MNLDTRASSVILAPFFAPCRPQNADTYIFIPVDGWNGFLIGIQPVVRKESVLKVLADKFPSYFMTSNTQALELGFELGRRYAE